MTGLPDDVGPKNAGTGQLRLDFCQSECELDRRSNRHGDQTAVWLIKRRDCLVTVDLVDIDLKLKDSRQCGRANNIAVDQRHAGWQTAASNGISDVAAAALWRSD